MKSKMTLEEFKQYVKEHDSNQSNAEGIGELFKDLKGKFCLCCLKCGSMNVQIIGDHGIDYGGETGYSPGSNVIKCKDCGNAVTWWK